MRDKIIVIANDALNSSERSGTWYYKLQRNDGKLWAICFAWMDYDSTGKDKLYGKVAYQPTNSLMQCDYDIDWLYPTFDNGDCDVCEYEIVKGNVEQVVDSLLKDWERMKKDYLVYED